MDFERMPTALIDDWALSAHQLRLMFDSTERMPPQLERGEEDTGRHGATRGPQLPFPMLRVRQWQSNFRWTIPHLSLLGSSHDGMVCPIGIRTDALEMFGPGGACDVQHNTRTLTPRNTLFFKLSFDTPVTDPAYMFAR